MKLQKLLSFICELTLRAESGRINEHLIGSEVFLRGPSYSPSEDSIVRRQAHSLRQKLQEYYAGEGNAIPTFRRVEADAVGAADARETRAIPDRGDPGSEPQSTVLVDDRPGGPRFFEPRLRGSVAAGPPTVIGFSSPMTAVIKHFDEALPASALPARFRAHAAEEELFSEAFRVPPGGAYYFTPAVNQTKIGEGRAGHEFRRVP